MRGRAHQLLEAFLSRHPGQEAAFYLSRLILLARVIPEDITPQLDDPEVERRLAAAVDRIEARASRPADSLGR